LDRDRAMVRSRASVAPNAKSLLGALIDDRRNGCFGCFECRLLNQLRPLRSAIENWQDGTFESGLHRPVSVRLNDENSRATFQNVLEIAPRFLGCRDLPDHRSAHGLALRADRL
jgi:hypothetical protein